MTDSRKLIFSLLIAATVTTAGPAALADPEDPANGRDGATPTSEAAAASEAGKQVYNAVCIACHSPPGVGGAPALGDGDAWSARMAQGMDTLIDHALNGYSGGTGIMPRKGGRLDLPDEDIIAAIHYMIEQIEQNDQ